MVRIVKTEFYKLKRYHILWAGVALMLLSVLLTLFTSMANDGSVWDFAYLTEQVIKNNMSMIFPMHLTTFIYVFLLLDILNLLGLIVYIRNRHKFLVQIGRASCRERV